MKIIVRIARTELAALFYSPIAWFILVVFSFLTAMRFVSGLEATLLHHDVSGYGPSAAFVSQTVTFFLEDYGFLGSIIRNLYIYIPLLTMGLLSRETASGSIKLLYSSPVTSGQIVLGKYLAAIVFGLCLMIVPTLGALCGSLLIPHFDWPPVLVGLTGLYLLVCAYCAVGLYLSSLTSYQVVAAIGTLAVLAALNFVGSVGQNYDFVRELTYWLSISGRTKEALSGVIRSEDVVYFLAVIALFLIFTVFRLSFGRRTIGRAARAACYAGVFAAVMAVGYLTSRPATVKVLDTTRTRLNSITDNSREVLDRLEGPVTITNYVNLLDSKSSRYLPLSIKQNEWLFERYRRAKPDLRERYVYYYDEAATGICDNPKFQGKSLEELRDYLATVYDLNPRLFLSPAEIRAQADLSGEGNAFVRMIRTADGRTACLRDFDDMQSSPGEAEITAALKKIVATPPSVAFLKGHGEREITRSGDRDYGAFSIEKYSRAALVNQGFEVCEIDLAAGEAIPDRIAIAVLADPRQPLPEADIAALEAYLDRGGNLLLLTDVGGQAAANPLLARLGLRMEEAQLAQPAGDFTPDLILAGAAGEVRETMPDFEHDFSASHLRVSMPGCVALSIADTLSGFRAVPMLRTGDKAWIEREQRDLREEPAACNPAAGEVERSYVVAYALERETGGRRQRVIVAGDAGCMSNAELKSQREGYEAGNFDLIVESFRFLSGGEFPIEVRRPECPDNRFAASVEAVAPVRTIFMILLPLAMLLTGVGLWFVRRRN